MCAGGETLLCIRWSGCQLGLDSLAIQAALCPPAVQQLPGSMLAIYTWARKCLRKVVLPCMDPTKVQGALHRDEQASGSPENELWYI